ncbi:3-phenylpropionate/trans-cinnamate dioxygenase ferredoxin reductase subunit [Rhodobium orientis]|uniref:Pyridine nucleotide-disulfide oxidoreductase n=1 Tax=Rhodobium orientis TaxID=34017 RepID=A0A327JUT4_9HYPH|nr:FAD-dependent oxidoreductase [Rhodobium orientis]MBB4301251.1 3-phenylpropionate/trans-cinnamate dioxygenase ferredoxin reductase subunit [Rhodobium orientis]MBK5951158.1 hypothetical protein [Rhodobium orientis]RAI29987.1 hypothetical protein CH339_00165 [Rhodobium orientis]
MSGVVIIGAGQGGYQTAESLRQEGYEGTITLIGAEPHLPYQRPPLSKAYLLGDSDAERVKFRTEAYYEERRIDLRTSTTATSVDRDAKTVTLADGSALAYDHLVIATGARIRELPVEGADLAGVCYMKTLNDADHIGALMETTERVVVVGAGFIGLEFAAVARKLGKDVTVLEAMDRVLGRVAPPILSDYFSRLHEGNGVHIRCGEVVAGIIGDDHGRVCGVRCADGHEVTCELVVVGIGVIPNVELAEAAGIDCDNGIMVDAHGRTSDPSVYALGDVANYEHPFAGKRGRLESVQNAIDQAKAVASAIAGSGVPYTTVPWFWSDQYATKLQMVGFSEGCDAFEIRGEIAEGKFSIFHYRGLVLRGIDTVNRPADHMMGRKLLAAGISPTPEQAADAEFALKSLL